MMNKIKKKTKAILSVDFEDYRHQQLRDHLGCTKSNNSEELRKQLGIMLELFDSIKSNATFFFVASLVDKLSQENWRDIISKHRIGCHGYEHCNIRVKGPKWFQEDLIRAKEKLEDISTIPVISYRSPYFSSDHCDPWFGEILAGSGYKIDSSKRIWKPKDHFNGTYFLEGSGNSILEIPFYSLGIGSKRLTIIGGTYLRILPLRLILKLLREAEHKGFIPMVYIHPYDVDPDAKPLEYPLINYIHKLEDGIRRYGRKSTLQKLRILSQYYEFCPIESI